MRTTTFSLCFVIISLATAASASQNTIGPNGINSVGLTTASGQPLTGFGVGIGQVEGTRPGKRSPAGADDNAHSNATIVPHSVFVLNNPGSPPANTHILNHAEWVAGVMISTDTTARGVAASSDPAFTADLYASAFVGDGVLLNQAAATTQFIATRNFGEIPAINLSFNLPLDPSDELDGNAFFTQFVDWSAATHDVLYVVAGRNEDDAARFSQPIDNYNGITVASSEQTQALGKYNRVSVFNDFSENTAFFGERTFIDILAPGIDVQLTGLADIPTTLDGTSFAAPHVTGTIALLQQYANDRVFSPRWDVERSRRHEVMKAVLLNSADKIEDNGTFGLFGSFLGMERTVVDAGPMFDGVGRQNWLESEAYGDEPFSAASFIPLDDQMGAGHLNAKRAVHQFSTGEYDSDGASVPAIGWDYGSTSGEDDINKYSIAPLLLSGTHIAVTLAWDRVVNFDNDGGVLGQYDVGDTFEPWTDTTPPADDVINDLDLYLLPAGSDDLDDAIAASISAESTIEHLFFDLPTTGHYEIWVHQWDEEATGTGQNYGIAWWAASAIDPSTGDYDGNGSVGPEDYAFWKSNFGTNLAAADGNGNGTVDAADYTVWRDNLMGSGSIAAVPEPSSAMLLLGLIGLVAHRRMLKPTLPSSPTRPPAFDLKRPAS